MKNKELAAQLCRMVILHSSFFILHFVINNDSVRPYTARLHSRLYRQLVRE